MGDVYRFQLAEIKGQCLSQVNMVKNHVSWKDEDLLATQKAGWSTG
jgi:hypothetical protein